MPLNKGNGVVDEKSEEFAKVRDKAFNARRANDRKGAWVNHLGPHHEKARKAEAVIAMEVAYGDEAEGFDAQLCLLEIDLAAFSGVKDIKLTLMPHSHRGEKPVRHGHHASGPEKYAVHAAPSQPAT
jgi:hypothetical protein